jgi:hypothetical protein
LYGWKGERRGGRGRILTTLIIPTRRFGGVALFETIRLMNLAVMPIMAMREQAWKRRASWKVAPRAP